MSDNIALELGLVSPIFSSIGFLGFLGFNLIYFNTGDLDGLMGPL